MMRDGTYLSVLLQCLLTWTYPLSLTVIFITVQIVHLPLFLTVILITVILTVLLHSFTVILIAANPNSPVTLLPVAMTTIFCRLV